MDTLYFIYMPLDQPSAHDFTKVHGEAVTGATWSQLSTHVTRSIQ